MSKKVSPVLVGSFVLGGVAIAMLGLVLFGGGQIFERKFYCVAYFQESLSGLDIGAPVEYKGVRIGTVSDVRLIVDQSEHALHRPVTISLEPNRVYLTSGGRNKSFSLEGFTDIVKKGLCAKLASQSMLTGKLKIELDFHPDSPVNHVDGNIDLPQLPTVLSPLASAKEKFEALPFVEMVTETRNLLTDLARIAGSEEARQLVPELNKTLRDVQALIASVEKQVLPMGRNLSEITTTGKTAIEELVTLTGDLSRLLTPLLTELTQATGRVSDTFDVRSSLRVDIEDVLESLAQAARAFAELADFLQRHPESLLRGKGGPP